MWVYNAQQISSKNVIINIVCDCKGTFKGDCIRKDIEATMHPTKDNVNRLGSYPDDERDSLKFDGIDFQTPVSQIFKIENKKGKLSLYLVVAVKMAPMLI